MNKVGWIRIDIQDSDERYRIHGFNNMLMTNNLDAALKFIEDQVLVTEVMNGMLPTRDDEPLEHRIQVKDTLNEPIIIATEVGQPIHMVYEDAIKTELDDNP